MSNYFFYLCISIKIHANQFMNDYLTFNTTKFNTSNLFKNIRSLKGLLFIKTTLARLSVRFFAINTKVLGLTP